MSEEERTVERRGWFWRYVGPDGEYPSEWEWVAKKSHLPRRSAGEDRREFVRAWSDLLQ